MGYKVIVLDPMKTVLVVMSHISLFMQIMMMSKLLNQLGENSDVVTYEFENISSEQLKTHSVISYSQGYQAIELLQDRLTRSKHY